MEPIETANRKPKQIGRNITFTPLKDTGETKSCLKICSYHFYHSFIILSFTNTRNKLSIINKATSSIKRMKKPWWWIKCESKHYLKLHFHG